MPVIHRTHVRISRIAAPLARRIGDHDFGLGANVGVALAEHDGIAVALRHLPPIEPRDPRRLRQDRLRLNQNVDCTKIRRDRAEFRPSVVYPIKKILDSDSLCSPAQLGFQFCSPVCLNPPAPITSVIELAHEELVNRTEMLKIAPVEYCWINPEAEKMVEAADDLPAEFDVRNLVFAYRHDEGDAFFAVNDDIGGVHGEGDRG